MAKYGVLQQELNYYGHWQLEKRTNWNICQNSVLVQSCLPGIVFIKNFTFLSNYILVSITKTYIENMVSVNDQLMVDMKNVGISYQAQAFTFMQNNGCVTFTITSASPSVSIQHATGHGTEVQLNFYNQKDRTYMYHKAGEQYVISLIISFDRF